MGTFTQQDEDDLKAIKRRSQQSTFTKLTSKDTAAAARDRQYGDAGDQRVQAQEAAGAGSDTSESGSIGPFHIQKRTRNQSSTTGVNAGDLTK